MRLHTTTLLATGLVATLAVLAFAGAFYNDEDVTPDTGYASTTLFTYSVSYQLSQDQSAPDAYLDIYTDSTLWVSHMMSVTSINNNIVYYHYTRTLPAGSSYSFGFHTFDDSTNLTLGPTVN